MLRGILAQKHILLIGNLATGVVLIFSLIFLTQNYNKFPDISVEEKAEELTQYLQVQVRLNLGIVGIARAQDFIELVGPPDRTVYSREEELTLRWSSSSPLTANDRYIVAVAYYRADERSYRFEPTVEYFETREQLIQLPQLNTSPAISVIAWMVYVSSGGNEVAGSMSTTNRLFFIGDSKASGGYQRAPDF
jgi:uncharacterized membrane protein